MNARRLAAICLAVGFLAPLAVGTTASAAPSELAPKHVLGTKGNSGDPSGDVKANRPHGSTSNGINYHGGSVMVQPTNAYIIWYGSWTGNTAQTILPNLLQHIGGSPYFNINTTYYDGSNVHVTNAVQLAGSTTMPSSSFGTSLSDSSIQSIVSTALTSHVLPTDANGVYFVLTSAGIAETSGFLTQYCGWHTRGTINGSDIKYAFVGDPTGPNVSACAAQTASSPNNNVGADAMASVIAHELEESVTDPDLNAWYDTRGYENADKCAWTFGTTSVASNLSKYNITFIDGSQYLIQRNWVNASGGYCSMSH